MSKADLPPVPPASRSTKGPGDQTKPDAAAASATAEDWRDRDLDKQGRQGNVKQNTTHKGYQQDR
jgi:ribonuclease HII